MLLLLLYVTGSAVAIGLLALLMHRLGQSEIHRFDDEAAARAQFLEDHPDAQIEGVELSADRGAALLKLAGGDIGLVRAMGRFHLARLIEPQAIVRLQRDGATLRLRMKDYTDPSFAIELASEERAREWLVLLDGRRRDTTQPDETGDRPAEARP